MQLCWRLFCTSSKGRWSWGGFELGRGTIYQLRYNERLLSSQCSPLLSWMGRQMHRWLSTGLWGGLREHNCLPEWNSGWLGLTTEKRSGRQGLPARCFRNFLSCHFYLRLRRMWSIGGPPEGRAAWTGSWSSSLELCKRKGSRWCSRCVHIELTHLWLSSISFLLNNDNLRS